jgi:hypothetical protein
LPFESEASEFIAGDPKLINFKYFFTRKLMFMKESAAFTLLPGGFGTMDEAFELLTLMQTGRSPMAPVVLLDPPGSTYWRSWRRFVEHELASRELISEDDLNLFLITEDIDEAVAEITTFYRVYHSSRFVGRRLVIRLNERPSAELLARLNEEFIDIIHSGSIEEIEPTQSEVDDDDHPELIRIGFRFDRRHFSRLRQMIDVINAS